MYKQKLGISVGNTYKVKTEEVIKIVADCKFDAVSPEWSPEYDIEKIAKTAYENGLTLQSLHAPFGGSASMWGDDKDAADDALKQLLRLKMPKTIIFPYLWLTHGSDLKIYQSRPIQVFQIMKSL